MGGAGLTLHRAAIGNYEQTVQLLTSLSEGGEYFDELFRGGVSLDLPDILIPERDEVVTKKNLDQSSLPTPVVHAIKKAQTQLKFPSALGITS